MVDSPKTCVDPYLDSFTQSFAAANYKAGTIKNYLHLVRKLGRLMDATGIEPSALSPDLADQLARTAARGPASKIRLHNLARQFTEHLINIGVAQPVPVSAAQVARTALLADLEAYLIKQRVSVRAPSAMCRASPTGSSIIASERRCSTWRAFAPPMSSASLCAGHAQ
jgi:integrase/recombinase XerD